MLGSEFALSYRTNSEAINGKLIRKAIYRRSIGIVAHANSGIDPVPYQRICALFGHPKSEPAGIILAIDNVGKGEERKFLSEMANALDKLHLRRLNCCLSFRPLTDVFGSLFDQIWPAEAIGESHYQRNET